MVNQKSEGEFLSIKEFARKLGVHSNTIRRAIKSKRISALRIGTGNRAVYRIANTEVLRMAQFDLEAYIEEIVQKRLEEKT